MNALHRSWTKAIGLIVLVLFLGIFYAGLTPFHAPANNVRWISTGNGIRLGRHGTIIGPNPYPPSIAGRTIEIWVEPETVEGGTTIAAFYNPAAPRFLSVSQEESDLEVRLQSTAAWRHAMESRLNLAEVFISGKSVLWAVSSGPSGTSVWRDGRRAGGSADLKPSSIELSGRLIIGNSPIFDNNWSGVVRGIAIYDRALTPEQALRHYDTWKKGSAPAIEPGDACAALYLFDEHAGQIVHNRNGGASDLYIPAKYFVLSPTLLDPLWRAFRSSRGFWKDASINLAGFIPPGFFLCAWFSLHGFRRPALKASVIGGAVSLFIEVAQTQLPTRDSSMSDLIMNIAGSICGALLYLKSLATAIQSGIVKSARMSDHPGASTDALA